MDGFRGEIQGVLRRALIFLLLPRRAKPSPVLPLQMLHYLKIYLWLIFHYPELADAVIYMDYGIPHGYHRNHPHIIIPTVGAVNDATMVCLDDTKVFIGAAPGDNMCFVSGRQLHGHP